MHSYLRAIGFSTVKSRDELEKIFDIIMKQPTEKYILRKSDNEVFCEIFRDFAQHIGLAIRGEFNEKGAFHVEHYFPYYRGEQVTAKEDIVINKRVDTDAYTGMCDDLRLGVSLIFYLQNTINYLEHKTIYDKANRIMPVSLAGLSLEGKVILGVNTDEQMLRNQAAETKQRNQLIAEARKGNQEAIDSLTIDDIDMYAMISRRARYEDVYSIVDNSFIPYGSESDNYSIIGTILDCNLLKNSYTNEEIYDMQISCNELIYHICINKLDLLGEPKVGRRFKGNIWMQGKMDFIGLA